MHKQSLQKKHDLVDGLVLYTTLTTFTVESNNDNERDTNPWEKQVEVQQTLTITWESQEVETSQRGRGGKTATGVYYITGWLLITCMDYIYTCFTIIYTFNILLHLRRLARHQDRSWSRSVVNLIFNLVTQPEGMSLLGWFIEIIYIYTYTYMYIYIYIYIYIYLYILSNAIWQPLMTSNSLLAVEDVY